MEIRDYLINHIKKHPYVQPRDIVKLCYQAANGAEHLLQNVGAAEEYFYREYESVSGKITSQETELFEEISPEVCRVNLAAWKASGMPSQWLFRMFVSSAEAFCEKEAGRLAAYLGGAEAVIESLTSQRKPELSFTLEEWKEFRKTYENSGMPAVHHSEIYREQGHPAYRIVSSRYLCILPILQKAAQLMEERTKMNSANSSPIIIALDGRAAAGKTTRAELLKAVLGAEVIHMDDFFLPPALRSAERLAEPGGNVHYERFAEEVLPYLRKPENFSYRIFDCGQMDFNGMRTIKSAASDQVSESQENIKLPDTGLVSFRIVEGSYSQHPKFGAYADLKVFCNVDPEEQMRRILVRNGEIMAEMFRNRWIPLEERYFEIFGILDKSDLNICAKSRN